MTQQFFGCCKALLLARWTVRASEMIEINLKELSQRIDARKAAIGGLSAERIARARNKGFSRTPEKRALLAKLDALAETAGREPSCLRHY